MAKLVSNRTAGRIMALLNRADLSAGRTRGGGAPRWAFVRCDSATAVGGSETLDECYPATVLSLDTNAALPPEDAGEVLLTLLTDEGAAAEPTEGAVYVCLMTGELLSDRTGTGPDAENGRCRAFGLVTPEPGVTGSGTNDTIARWNGTAAIQGSTVFLDDSGVVTVTDPSPDTGTSQVKLVPASASSRAHPYTFLYFFDGVNAHRAYFYLNDTSAGCDLPFTHDFVIGNSDTGAGPTISSSYAVTRGFVGSPTVHTGIDGTLAPGMTVTGGIITGGGSGSFVSTSAANTFTNSQLFQPATTSGVPVTAQGLSGQTGNLFEGKTNTGTVVASLTPAGVFTAVALNGTYDAGTF